MTKNKTNHPYRGLSSTVSGTVRGIVCCGPSLKCLGYKEKLIILKNTDAVNGITYKIDGYTVWL